MGFDRLPFAQQGQGIGLVEGGQGPVLVQGLQGLGTGELGQGRFGIVQAQESRPSKNGTKGALG